MPSTRYPFKRWNTAYATGWTIDLAYNFDNWSTDNDLFLEGIVGQTCDMAGSGFGLRDMQFDFGFRIWNKWQAKRAYKRLVRISEEFPNLFNFDYIQICEPYDYRDDEEDLD